MSKKLVTIFTIFFLTSCTNWLSKEVQTSAKSSAASGRISASDENSKNIFKELDE